MRHIVQEEGCLLAYAPAGAVQRTVYDNELFLYPLRNLLAHYANMPGEFGLIAFKVLFDVLQ